MDYKTASKTLLDECAVGVSFGLDRIKQLNNLADNPDLKLKFIHVAGTNGKGSTSNMISSILVASGYKTGLFTSPCIFEFNERFQINGKCISDDELYDICNKLKDLVKFMDEPPTEFEFITMIALKYFEINKCDIVVMEVGLGGRLDSTNIIANKEVCVITNIGYDHMDKLGETLEDIAYEKAGIISPHSNVVVYDQTPKVLEVIKQRCTAVNAQLKITKFDKLQEVRADLTGQTFKIDNERTIQLSTLGVHQQKNACVAIDAVRVLCGKGFDVPEEAITTGLKNSKVPLRFQIAHKDPVVVLDVAHNPQSFLVLCENLKKYFNKPIVFVMGVLKDKDYKKMVEIISPITKKAYAVSADSERALPSKRIVEVMKEFKIPVEECFDAEAGLKRALQSVKNEDVICVAGSFYLYNSIKNSKFFTN